VDLAPVRLERLPQMLDVAFTAKATLEAIQPLALLAGVALVVPVAVLLPGLVVLLVLREAPLRTRLVGPRLLRTPLTLVMVVAGVEVTQQEIAGL
jgi:hypothetical protein